MAASRCSASVSRKESFLSFIAFAASSSGGMSGGGGGGGVPRRLSRMNKPRFTGEVRVGFEVTASTEPCVMTPPRGLSAGSLTRDHFIARHVQVGQAVMPARAVR